MSVLILPSRRVVQPQGPVQIDFGNPLCRGISEVITTEGVLHRSVISGAVHAYAGVTQNPAISARFGFGGQNYANGSPAIKAIPDTSDATIFAAGRVPNQTNLRAAVQLGSSSTSIPSLSIDIGDGTTAGVVGGRAYLDGTRVFGRSFTLAIGSDYAAVARQKKGVQQDLWVNGVKDPTTTAFTAGSAGYTHFGRPGSESYGIPLFIAIAWNRAISDSEIRAISENPWQIFKPVERRIFVPASGGGGGLSQSIALTTDDAAVSVSQSLGHSQSLGLTTDSATVSIAQALTHSQALTLTTDDSTVSVNQAIAGANAQSLSLKTDDSVVSFAQAVRHSQTLTLVTGDVQVSVAQALSHGQTLGFTTDNVTISIAQSAASPNKDQALTLTTDDAEVSISQIGAAPSGGLTTAARGLTPKVWPFTVRYEGKQKRKHAEPERIQEIAEEAVIQASEEPSKRAMRASLEASMKAAELEIAAATMDRLLKVAVQVQQEKIEIEEVEMALMFI